MPERHLVAAPVGATVAERLEPELGALAYLLVEAVRDVAGPAGDLFESHRARVAGLFPRPPPRTGLPAEDPLERLARSFALSPFEVDLLLLSALPHHHEALTLLLRSLHPRGEPCPTVGLAAQLFCRAEGDRRLFLGVVESGALAGSGVVRAVPEGPFPERSLVLADALWPVLNGHETAPSGVRALEDPPLLAGLAPWLEASAGAAAVRALSSGQRCLVVVTAETGEVALHRGAALAAWAERGAWCVTVEGRPNPEVDRLLSVHAVARGAVPVVRFVGAEGPAQGASLALDGHPGPVVLCVRAGTPLPRARRPVVVLPADRPSPRARVGMWRELCPELAEHAPTFAARYALEPHALVRAVEDARHLGRLEGRPHDAEDVARAVRARSHLSLSPAVSLVRPAADWSALVLAPESLEKLREAVGRLEQQATVLDDWGFLEGRPGARGVRLLLSGTPGTGKSLSAEVLAAALGVDLLAVDISRVVSKWIGETEKNLSEVFDAAERSQAVLFFDEADALFGVRTEVSDAHDRYANLETAYLLSRLERFEGLAVLATNLKTNIDPAFLRRLEFVVELDEPDLAQREALWRVHLPKRAPLGADVDLRELAQVYAVVGGLIKNAAVAAAFLAAAEGTPIGQRHLVRAVRREYEKSGKAFPGIPAGMTYPFADKEPS